mgnify:CR=1 FL=1
MDLSSLYDMQRTLDERIETEGDEEVKKTRIIEYENMPVRYNPDVCPTCKHFTGTTCRIHVSNVERQATITQTYCIRKIDFEHPYKNKKRCQLQEQYAQPFYVQRLDEE